MLVALCLNKVSCFIMLLYKIYTMYSILKGRQCVFLFLVKKQSGIGFIVDALFGYFTYLRSLYKLYSSRTAYKLCIVTFWKAAYLTIERPAYCTSYESVGLNE